MSWLLYWPLLGLVAFLQALPLRAVARAGRVLAFLWWLADAKHRKLVKKNLRAAFPGKSEDEIHAIARETFQRIGENALAAIKTASLDTEASRKVCEVVGLEKLPSFARADSPRNCIAAIGHFGNFELYALLAEIVPGVRPAATYRGMNQPGLDAVVQRLRQKSGCVFYERRKEAAALKKALSEGGLFLGLLSDQHPNKGGVLAPFMGRPCATSAAPAILALRYEAPLLTVICYRVALARWKIEIGDEIPLHENGAPRSLEAIMADVNKAFEAAVRRDPSNWFWVHNRWKKPRLKGRMPDAPAAGPTAEPAPL